MSADIHAADAITRSMLITAMLLVPVGIALILLDAQTAGFVLFGFGIAGTLGTGAARSSLRKSAIRYAPERSAGLG